jgi:hypothetical protein
VFARRVLGSVSSWRKYDSTRFGFPEAFVSKTG